MRMDTESFSDTLVPIYQPTSRRILEKYIFISTTVIALNLVLIYLFVKPYALNKGSGRKTKLSCFR